MWFSRVRCASFQVAKALVCVVSLLTFGTIASVSSAGRDSVGAAFQPKQYPSSVGLSVNNEPALCDDARTFMTDEVRSLRFDPDIGGRQWPPGLNSRFDWIFTKNLEDAQRSSWVDSLHANLYRQEFDFDGDGNREVITLVRRPFRMNHDDYDLMLFPSSAALDNSIADGSAAFRAAGKKIWEKGAIEGSDWIFAAVLRYGNNLYLYERGNELDYDRASVSLLRIHSDGTLSEACRLEQHDYWERMVAETMPALLAYRETLREIAGDSFRCSSWDPGYYERNVAKSAFSRVLNRPWVLLEDAHFSRETNYLSHNPAAFNTRHDVEVGLFEWSYGSLSQYRLLRRVRQLEPEALNELEFHYETQFGVTAVQARLMASRALDKLLRYHFGFGIELEYLSLEDQNRVPTVVRIERAKSAGGARENISTAEATVLLERAALEGLGEDTIAWLLKVGAYPGDAELARWSGAETPLYYALEHPRIVKQLLDAGAKPNHGNSFGKTPLMYAAQYNLLEAVRALLDAGADPNARTASEGDCMRGQPVKYGSRSALMYAAENGSAELMELLIRRGADVMASDTKKRSVMTYLELNSGMSDTEKAYARQLLRGN